MTNKQQVLKNSFTLLTIIAVLLLASMIVLVFILQDKQPDEYIFAAIAPHITDSRTAIMNFISFYGNHLFLIPANLLLLLYFIVKKNKWMAITAAAVSISSVGLMSLLKNLFHRQRPAGALVQGVTNFSFPSGHAFMSVAFYGLLIWLTVQYTTDTWRKRSAIIFLLSIIILIGFSRIYLRMHYTTDVIAGLSMGTVWLLFIVFIVAKIKEGSTRHGL
jgi:membrane-associated phospholipid phosphatase